MITIIAAMSENRVIGRGGGLPWLLRDDLVHFKRLTVGCAVIMGRKTWESIGCRPLPKRVNIVLTRDRAFEAHGAAVAHSVDEAITIAHEGDSSSSNGTICIVGGEAVYRAFLPLAHRMELTIVHATIENGDAFFPEFDGSQWRTVREERREADARNEYAFTFRTLERR